MAPNGWTARVLKNEEDEGWAVEMHRAGDPEPALVGPWTMGRDKKNPKPLDASSFATLVKTASEVIRRTEQALAPRRLRFAVVLDDGARGQVECLDIHDEDDPHTRLTVTDLSGEVLHEKRVAFGFKLRAAAAEAFARTGTV